MLNVKPTVFQNSGFVDPGAANLIALTEGIHSKEALELVREHMLGVMGAAANNKFSTELIKMSKFQMAQVRGVAGSSWRCEAASGSRVSSSNTSRRRRHCIIIAARTLLLHIG